MKQKKLKRLAALALCLCLMLGLMPFNAADVSAKPDKTKLTEEEGGDKDMLGLPDSASQIEEYGGSDHPYGRAGWFNINPVSELSVFASLDDTNRYRDYSFARDNTGNVTGIKPQNIKVPKYNDTTANKNRLSSTDSKSRKYRFAQSVAFDPGSPSVGAKDPAGKGQDRFLATVAYDRNNNLMYLIVSKADNTGEELARINLAATNTTEDFGHFHDSDSLQSHRYHGTFSITAGDFNGDGEDSIIVYRPIMAENGNCAPVLSEYRFNTEYNTILSYEGDLNQDLYGASGLGPFKKSADKTAPEMTSKDFFNSDNIKKRTRNTPIIQMTAEDTDRDGRDELVVAAGFANVNGSADKVPQLGSQLLIFERGGENNTWTRSLKTPLSPENKGTESEGRLRYAGVSVGSMIMESTGTDYPEIIAAGYVDGAGNSGNDIQKNIEAYIYRCNSTNNNYLSTYSFVKNEKIGKNPVSEKFSETDDYLDTVQVTAFAAKGAGQAEYVVIEGMVWGYEHDEEKKTTVFKNVFTPNLFHASEKMVDGAIIAHNNVQEAVAGNFDGNTDGREQVIGLLVYRQQSSNNYYYRIVTLGLQEEADSTWKWFDTNADSYEVYQSSGAVVSLAAVDTDRFRDGTLGKIQSRVDNYTKPGVLAILEAAPYFKEIKVGARNGGTSYGTSAETGKAASTSNTVSANVLFGYEYESTGMGYGFEANFEHKSTWSSTKSTSTTFSTEHYNDSDDNQVLVYRAPLSHYIYQTILPDGTSGQMNIVVQGEFATNMVPVKTYNTAAEAYGLELIDEGMLGKPGSPANYNKGVPLESKVVYQAKETSSYSSGGTTKQSVTYTEGQETSYEYSFGVSLQGYGLTGGVKFGGGAGYENAQNKTTINSNSVTKEGAVSGRESSVPDTYDFDWRFATWDIHLNDSDIPVLGYLVNNVSAPPAPPVNLNITEEMETSLKLSWDHSSDKVVKYNIYRYIPEYQQNPYVKVGSVNGAKQEFTVTKLSPATTYQYVIRSEGYVRGKLVESVVSETAIGTTIDVGGIHPQISGPGDTTAEVGGTAYFKVRVKLPDLYTHYDYVWQERQAGSQWKALKSGDRDSLAINNITEEHEGRQYRYVVTAYKSDGSPIPYYSQAATLTLGKIRSEVSLYLGFGYTPPGGKGTISNPYYGAAARTVDTPDGSEFQKGETFRVATNVRDVWDEDCFIQGIHLETGETFSLTVKLQGLSPFVDWTPDKPGLYALTAYYPGSAVRQPGYSETLYFQSIEAVDRQYRLALLGSGQKILPDSAEYGTIIRKAKLYYKEITWEDKNGKPQINLSEEREYASDNLSFTNTLTAGDKTDSIKDPFGATGTNAYMPGSVGTHTISVSEDGVNLAQAVLKITPRNVSVRPAWTGTLPPDSIGEIGVEIVPGTQQLAADDALDNSWFTVSSNLYDENGSRIPDVEGNITVELSRREIPVEEQTEAYQRFMSCYQILTQNRNTTIEKDSYNVNYAVASGSEAGGTLEGRYGEKKTVFKTGTNIPKDTTVEFIATPNQTYAVDHWMNNGVPISPSDVNYTYNADRTVMTVSYLKSALDITVSYKKTDDILLYYQSENKNRGSVSAVYNSGEGSIKIDDGNIVPWGSDITLTANPKPDMAVQKWIVNGKEHCWEDGKTPYRENELTLQNVSCTNDVTVHFARDDQYQLKAVSVYEDGADAQKAPVISDYAGKTIKPGKVTGGKRLNFKAETLDGSAIIEWRISKGDGDFVKIPGSEYQTQIILLDGIHEKSTVQAVYTKDEVTVKVTPETTRLACGEQQQFAAGIQGNETWGTTPPQEVTWRVEGASSVDTTITDTGLLSVAADETAEQITVSAASAWAPYSAEGKAVVTVYESVPPTGKILMDIHEWHEFKNVETFELFYKDEQTITITAEDNSKKDVTIEYFLSTDTLTLENVESKTEGWNAYNGPFNVTPDNKFIVYGRLTDSSGNRTYICSEGVVLDCTLPVIDGAENEVFYDTALSITVTDDYLDTVTVNDLDQTVVDGSSFIILTENGEYTIRAKDKADNETIYKVTVEIPATSYVLIFDTDGGAPIPPVQTLEAGNVPAAVEDPVKKGFVFQGWYNEADEFVDLSEFTMPENTVTLKAKWEEAILPPATYTLTFDAAGGSPEPAPQILEVGAIPAEVQDPAMEGFTFQGWYSDGDERINLSEFTMPDSDVTLTAKWEESVIQPATYTLTFDAAGGSPVPAPQILEVGAIPVGVEDPAKEGYIFQGWYNDGDEKINLSEFMMPDSDVTLTAKWEESVIQPATYTLTFDAAGGSPVPAPQILEAGAIPVGVEDPAKEGYIFQGWYNDGDEKINLSEFTMPDSDITLHAKWEESVIPPATYTLTFDTACGEPVPPAQTLGAGETPTAVEDPTKKGYTFEGWYNEGDENINLAEFKMPESDITLTAKWKTNTYVLTVENGTGSGTYEAGQIVSIAAEVPSGKIFKGWELKSGDGVIENVKNEKTTFTVAEENAVVAAVFEDAKPSDPAKPSNPSTSGGGSQSTGSSGTKAKATPKTGDQTMMWPLWTAIFSLGVIGLTAAKRKKNKRK